MLRFAPFWVRHVVFERKKDAGPQQLLVEEVGKTSLARLLGCLLRWASEVFRILKMDTWTPPQVWCDPDMTRRCWELGI